MTNYVHADNDGNIIAILSDSTDQIPAEAEAITQDQVDEWNASNHPRKWVGGAFVQDDAEITRQAGERKIRDLDRNLENANLRAALVQCCWVVGELIDVADLSSLSAQKQARINNIGDRLTKLGQAFRAKKQAEADILSGTDPDTITLPDVDSLDI